MKVTKKQIQQHYMDAGMPEVYAYMAAQETTDIHIQEDASSTLWGGFVWEYSKQGHDFWMGVVMELEHGAK